MPDDVKPRTRRAYPDDWVVMTSGRPPAPGVPIGKKSVILHFDEIKHLLSDVPLARPGDPAPRSRKSADQ